MEEELARKIVHSLREAGIDFLTFLPETRLTVPSNATDILISEAYRWAFARQDQYGYAAAYAALIFVILLAWSWISMRVARAAETRA